MLGSKVITCPRCGKIKSLRKPCKHCGYDPNRQYTGNKKLATK